MAKKKVKISFNTAVDRIKKSIHEYCIDFYLTAEQTEALLDVVERHRRTSSTQTIPPPPNDPPGGKNP